jgi:hypothetical protein
MGRFACGAGGVVCQDGWRTPASTATTHPAPGVECGSRSGYDGEGAGLTAVYWSRGRARLHVVVTVTASLGHPLGCPTWRRSWTGQWRE